LFHLAVFLPEWSSFNLGRQFQLLNSECLKRAIAFQLFFTHKGNRLVEAYEQIKFQPQEGGIVLLTTSPRDTQELSAAFDDKGYRYVIVDVATSNDKQFSIITSNQSIVQMGMDYLVKAGHRKIVFLVNEPEDNENVKERVATFERYVATSAVPLQTKIYHCAIQTWEDSTAAVVRVMGEIWSSQSRPTAIFTGSDYGAVTVITWLQRQGVQVPKEVSVLGVDGSEIGKMIRPALTSIAQPFEEINEMIFKILEDPNATPRRICLEPHLLLQESVASPASLNR
jgi:LacI family transcriptional regulator